MTLIVARGHVNSCNVTIHVHVDGIVLTEIEANTALDRWDWATKKHAKHICVSSGKMAQDVGMVWVLCHSHLVWLDF